MAQAGLRHRRPRLAGGGQRRRPRPGGCGAAGFRLSARTAASRGPASRGRGGTPARPARRRSAPRSQRPATSGQVLSTSVYHPCRAHLVDRVGQRGRGELLSRAARPGPLGPLRRGDTLSSSSVILVTSQVAAVSRSRGFAFTVSSPSADSPFRRSPSSLGQRSQPPQRRLRHRLRHLVKFAATTASAAAGSHRHPSTPAGPRSATVWPGPRPGPQELEDMPSRYNPKISTEPPSINA